MNHYNKTLANSAVNINDIKAFISDTQCNRVAAKNTPHTLIHTVLIAILLHIMEEGV